MIEDEVLKWKFKAGSQEALRRIYEKYLNRLLSFAMALLNDVVHDVFVSFATSAETFRFRGNLRSYLTTCVLNRARDYLRANQRRPVRLDGTEPVVSDQNRPDQEILYSERAQQLNQAIAQLPDEQRQVIVLHLKGEMKFRDIARLQNVSINTVQGRYRYGLEKVRSTFNGEVEK
jgi:RNA polymerase sigma-70 factor (ECF subfamily)